MRKSKFAYVRTQFWFNLKAGGSVGHTLGVLNELKKRNCELFVVSNEHFLGIEDFDYSITEPKVKRFPGELLYNFYAGRGLKRKFLEVKPDLIYHRYTGHTFFVSKIAKKLGIPLILEFNSFDTWKMRHWGRSKKLLRRCLHYILYNIVKQIEVYNLKNAFLIITVSQPLKTDLLKMGIPERKILVSPNSVDPNKFNSRIGKGEKCKALRQKLDLGNKIVVGFSGTFGPWHGIPQLTEAIDQILGKNLSPNIHFLLIGDGPLRRDMEKQVGHYRDLTFTGQIPYSKVQYYLGICDILVSPHNHQIDGREFFGSPTKLFEYMAMGKGIVASDLGQIGEVLEHGKTAWLVKPGDVGELVEGILRLAQDRNLREQLGRNARKEVLAKYTWEKHVQHMLDRLRELGIG